jgi:hypothetical protein
VNKRLEFWITVVSLVAGSLIFLYTTFLTRAEANDRKDARDKTERIILDTIVRIEEKLDNVLMQKK